MNQPAEAYVCPDGEHAWSSSHEPHAPIWIISCIICGRHNFTEMLAEHDRAVAEAAAKQALEDAADAIYHKQHPESVRQMLRARAASVSTDKAGAGDGADPV